MQGVIVFFLVNIRQLMLFILLSFIVVPSISDEVQSARLVVNTFAKNLQNTLATAMMEGGPVNAVTVCHDSAIKIAEFHSSQSGWQVSRTALKIRNPANAPDDWELKTLRQFEQRKASGEKVTAIEYSEWFEESGQRVFRYMKPIATTGICLSCHGGSVDEGLAIILGDFYPDDKATGFNVGDIRGAFSLKKYQ